MEGAEVNEHGAVSVDGRQVSIAELTEVWRHRKTIRQLRTERDAAGKQNAATRGDWAREVAMLRKELDTAERSLVFWKTERVPELIKERDAAAVGEAKARDAFDVVVRSHEDMSAKLRGERDAAVARLVSERDDTQLLLDGVVKERNSYRDALYAERESNVGHKRLWLVSRTTTVQRGEYGRVVVSAESTEDAATVVLSAGHFGQPLYGYSDHTGMLIEPLSADDGREDGVIVAETLS